VPLLVFRRHLGEDGARGKIRAVGFDAEGLGWVGRDENQSGGDTLFQPGESSSLGFFPAPAGVVSGQIEEQAGVFQEVFDEPLIEVGEPEEGLHLLLVRRSGPLGDTGNLDWIHRDRVVEDDDSEVLDRGFLEFAFVGMEVKLMFLQKLQNVAGDLSVLLEGLREDKYIVQIDYNHAF